MNKSNVEPIVCEECHHVNVVYRKEFERRDKESYHYKLEPAVASALRYWCRGYGTYNTGISMMLYELEKLKSSATKNLISKIPVSSVDDRIAQSYMEKESKSQ